MSTSSSSLPVVWCTDRNSADNKPTAFALQGIHLQGNINEHHVIAVRELINAASEGRLLLPSDGGVVVLNCGGSGVGSLIVSSNEQSKGVDNKEDESKTISSLEKKNCGERQDRPIFSINNANNEMLYEFLCCARCMSEGTKCCNNNGGRVENLKIIEKYLDVKIINAGKATAIRRIGNHQHKPIKHRRKNKYSFKSENRVIASKRVGSSFPIYATVNKPKNREQILSLREHKRIETNDVTNSQQDQFLPPTLSDSFRKTSFDSTCTINSIDSGFIDMQSKGLKNIKENNVLNSVEINIIETPKLNSKVYFLEHQDQNNFKIASSSWNRLTVPQQSRNRRKSYEEFKSLFSDPKNNLRGSVDETSKSRRKSYEELKTATNVICGNNEVNINNMSAFKNDLNIIKNESDNSSNNLFTRLRRGSKRFSQKSSSNIFKKPHQEIEVKSKEINTIYDILRRTCKIEKISMIEPVNRKQISYDKNLELFESHCNNENNSFRNNLKSYGTIYDIVQNQNDTTYDRGGKKYDKYMTYGTLYEILHRKSDEGEIFDRKRTFSEKFSNKQRKNSQNSNSACTTPLNTKQSSLENNQIAGNVTDTNCKNLNSSNISGSLKQGSCIANNQLSITSSNGKQLSTIYDILQTKKLDTAVGINSQLSHPTSNRNRFLVRKITEEELFELQKEETRDRCNKLKEDMNQIDAVLLNNKSEHQQNTNALMTNKKQTKLRRFSNILSYSPNKICNVNSSIDLIETNLLEDSEIQKQSSESIDDTYARLNRTHLKQIEIISNTNEPNCLSIKNKVVICKSSSMENILNAENNKEFPTRNKNPHRKISVPVHLPPKILPRKSTRRLSEFTRGEFLNEKL